MWKTVILMSAMILGASMARAGDMAPIKDEGMFLSYLDGRSLTIRMFGLTIDVAEDGTIGGKAVGRPITGSWSWQDGFFCREMAWGAREIPYNCQLVEAAGNEMRFTTDKGAGDSADFRLR